MEESSFSVLYPKQLVGFVYSFQPYLTRSQSDTKSVICLCAFESQEAVQCHL